MTGGSCTEKAALKWVAQYQGHGEDGRWTYRATLCDLSYDLEKIPTNAFEFAAWLNALLEPVPEQYRDGAVLILRNDECYECSSERAQFTLYVDRDETDEEYAARMEKVRQKRDKDAAGRAIAAAQKAEEKERHDKAEFERLKAKYGS